MGSEQGTLLRRYLKDEIIDIAKLREQLEEASATDRWNMLKTQNAALHKVVWSNDVSTAEYMLQGFQPDQVYDLLRSTKNSNGNEDTPVHIAACEGHIDMVSLFLNSLPEKKLDLVKLQNKEEKTALHVAVNANKADMVELLLSSLSEDERYEVLMMQDNQDETALHTATSKAHTGIVKYTLESVPNARLNLLKVRGRRGDTVLRVAVDASNVEMVALVLSTLTENQRYDVLKHEPVLHFAASEGHTAIVKCLMESVPNKILNLLKRMYGRQENTPLHAAAIEKKSETVLSILQLMTPEMLKELLTIKNRRNQTIADLAAPELYYLSTTEDIGSSRQQLTAVERQLRADLAKQTEDSTAQIGKVQLQTQQQDEELTTLKVHCKQQEAVISRQAEELTLLKESSKRQDVVIIKQSEELQQLRERQTEMLGMIADLRRSLGTCFSTADTSDQENETDCNNNY